MRYLAIDHGDKRTGLALCDDNETMASPLTVLTQQDQCLIDKILNTIEQNQIEAIVIGLPLNMDSTQSNQTRIVHRFAETLKKNTDLPIHFQDERLSSFDAEKKLAGLSLTRKKKKKHLDAVAAASILQSFIDNKNKPQM
jgi:putative Holliday junction resolvase